MKKYKMISKSQYLLGLQCPKALWYYRHRPDLKPPVSETQQHLFDTGHEVGRLAQEYFSGGIEIIGAYYKILQHVKSTQQAIIKGEKIVYEASAASSDGAYSRIDIFKKVSNAEAWDLIEVKSSTSVHDYHYDDMALQRYAFVNAGYPIRHSILMHINKAYVKKGELDLNAFFTLEDCTEIVIERTAEISERVKILLDVLNSDIEPEIEIGSFCYAPFECDYLEHCWAHIPEYSVYNTFRGTKLDQLLSADILNISDVPDSFDLTDRQAIEVDAYKNNTPYIDNQGLRDFISELIYPLFYLDYETINPAIPLFDQSSPYQLIPFQFSLHIQRKPGEEPEHIEFLHTGKEDPRPAMIKSLIKSCESQGSVVVYNQTFESRINNELARDFPEYREALNNITGRMVDLFVPFRSRLLYHPDMKGSASLKSVLPALIPDMEYDALEISEGNTASLRYLKCIKDEVPEATKKDIYSNLKAYCKMDTLAEVKLMEVLYEIAEQP